MTRVSIHARLATGDLAVQYDQTNWNEGFNSRPSCDGRLAEAVKRHRERKFQFTPVLRRATICQGKVMQSYVSIHARLATGDGVEDCRQSIGIVSIHARLATGDIMSDTTFVIGQFQFTPVLRRATKKGGGND